MSSARLRPLAILLGILLLAGCGTGQHTQTASQQSAVDGAEGNVGPIAVRNAQLAYPEGGAHRYQRGDDAPLIAVIVNTGTTEDELASVSSPAAEAVRIEGQRRLPPLRTLRAVAPSENATQAGGQELTMGQVRIVLSNVVEDVRSGMTVDVTLLFRQAGELTAAVPIGPPPETSAASGS